jgi:hypothetical protein
MRTPARLYFLAGCLAVVAFYTIGQATPLRHMLVYDSIGLSAVIAVAAGVRYRRPARRAGWILLAAGQMLFVAGDIAFTSYQLGGGSGAPYPSVADVFYLLAYPLLTAGLVVLARGGDRRRSLAALVDATVIAIAIGLALWPFTIAPLVHDGTGPSLPHVISLLYPFWDLVLLGAVARLFFSGSRGVASALLLAAMSLLFAADLLYATPATTGAYAIGSLPDAGWL